MSIYNDLNNVGLDLTEYEEHQLSTDEQVSWERRVRRKLPPRSTRLTRRWAAAAAAFIIILSAVLSHNQISLAKMPFAERLIEQIIGRGQQADYSPYKTAIGETATNAQGRMTLNELMIEGDRLLINATFEPAEGVVFSEENRLFPHVTVNGIEGEWSGMNTSESVDPNGIYTLFGSINLLNLPEVDTMQVKVTYDLVNYAAEHPIHVKQPWAFNVELSASAINRDTITVQLDKKIQLAGYGEVTIEKVMASPASTLLYYKDNPAMSEGLVKFKLVNASGEEVKMENGFITRLDINGDSSWNRYAPIDLNKDSYSLIPIDSRSGKELDEAIELKV